MNTSRKFIKGAIRWIGIDTTETFSLVFLSALELLDGSKYATMIDGAAFEKAIN